MLTNLIFSFIPVFVSAFWAITLLIDYKTNKKAKNVLGIFMVLSFVLFFTHSAYYMRDYILYLYLDSIYIFSVVAIYPIYYLYLRLIALDYKFSLKKLWIIIPASVLFLFSIVTYSLISPEEANAYIHQFIFGEKGNFNFSILGVILMFISKIKGISFIIGVITVLYLGSRLILNYNKHINNYYSNPEGKSILWGSYIFYLFIVHSTFSIVFSFIGISYFASSSFGFIASLIFGIDTYLFGLLGYKQTYTIENLENEEKEDVIKISSIVENEESLKNRLINLMEKKELYRQQDLRITDIANKLKSNRTYISQIINNDLNCSFSDFVNRYRVNYAKKLLQNSDLNNYNMEYFSEQSGFASLNSFLRAFKKEEGITPGKYKEELNQ